MYEQFRRELNKCKFEAFGKITFKPKLPERKDLDKLMRKKKQMIQKSESSQTADDTITNIDNKIMQTVNKIQKVKLEKDFMKLKSTIQKKGTNAAIFQLRKSLVGGKV